MHSIETTSKETTVKRYVTEEMSFNVIVTFKLTPKVLKAIDGMQVMFDLNTVVTPTIMYDKVMYNVAEEAVRLVKWRYKLGKRDIVKISTCGDWNVWERLTGRNSDDDAKISSYAKNGKIYF